MLWLWLLGASELPWLGNVDWTDVDATEGCFFFAGPGDLGRDEPLGFAASVKAGPPKVVRFGDAVFTERNGVMERHSTHDFSGPWEALQTMEGTWTGETFSGRYAYVERRKGEDVGNCTITAGVTIRPERSR